MKKQSKRHHLRKGNKMGKILLITQENYILNEKNLDNRNSYYVLD